MKPAFLQRLRYWMTIPTPIPRGQQYVVTYEPATHTIPDQPAHLSDFGPNVPVENLGGTPVFYENGQPVYWEYAP